MKNMSKCAKHSTIALIVYTALGNIRRFAGVPKEDLLKKIGQDINKVATDMSGSE